MIQAFKDKPTQIMEMIDELGLDCYMVAENKLFLVIMDKFNKDEVDIEWVRDAVKKLAIFNPQWNMDIHVCKYKFVIKLGLDICGCGKVKGEG